MQAKVIALFLFHVAVTRDQRCPPTPRLRAEWAPRAAAPMAIFSTRTSSEREKNREQLRRERKAQQTVNLNFNVVPGNRLERLRRALSRHERR
jgi:hypothetical protein